MGRTAQDPMILKLTLSPLEWRMYELLYQQSLSYMLPKPALEHKRIVYRSNCALLLACAAVKARKGEEGYYFLGDDWPDFRWPVYEDLPVLDVATIKNVESRYVLGPTPGQFLRAVFDPSWLCTLKAERAIDVVFGLEPWDPVCDDARDMVPMVSLSAREGSQQVELTNYGQTTLKTWKEYGLAESAIAFTSARNRMKKGAIDLQEALVEVVSEAGFPHEIAHRAHRQVVDQMAHFRALRAQHVGPSDATTAA